MIIYKATSYITGLSYIGSTIRPLYDRKYRHRKAAENINNTSHFYNAIRKYGIDGFEWQVIDDTADSMELLARKEEAYIMLYGTYVNGYNSSPYYRGGCDSAETRAKLSAAHKGEKNHFYGKTHSEEAKAQMSVAKKTAWASEEYRTRMIAAKKGNTNHLGKKHSKEAKAKMSASRYRFLEQRGHDV
jgi:group I intron endonuclease